MPLIKRSLGWDKTSKKTTEKLPQLKFSDGDIIRVHIFPDYSTEVIRRHYVENSKTLRFFYCHSDTVEGIYAACCDQLKNEAAGKNACVLVVMKYDTKKNGEMRKDIDSDGVYSWAISFKMREVIFDQMTEMGKSLDELDFVIKVNGDGMSRTYNIKAEDTVIDKGFLKSDIYSKAIEEAKDIHSKIYTNMASVITEDQLRKGLEELNRGQTIDINEIADDLDDGNSGSNTSKGSPSSNELDLDDVLSGDEDNEPSLDDFLDD